MSFDELWRRRCRRIISIENGQFFSTKSMANDDSSEPLDALIPKIPFSFFVKLWVRVTSGARRSVSVGFWGGMPIEPFWGGV